MNRDESSHLSPTATIRPRCRCSPYVHAKGETGPAFGNDSVFGRLDENIKGPPCISHPVVGWEKKIVLCQLILQKVTVPVRLGSTGGEDVLVYTKPEFKIQRRVEE
jgi:hypothetical protein